KLKDELNGLRANCKGEIECYQKIISARDPTGKNNVPSICNSHIQDLDDNTFFLFKKFENLYNSIYDILNEYKGCPYDSKCFMIYKELCEKCKNDNNDRLRILLKKFKDEHLKNV
ncbi:variable surface protein, partial [Plasmodium gonderi]